MTLGLYVLDAAKNPVPAASFEAWSRAFAGRDRHVGYTGNDDLHVSTVFLGLEHGQDENGQPFLFETMIFGGPHDGYQERRATWAEAEAAHVAACLLAGIT